MSVSPLIRYDRSYFLTSKHLPDNLAVPLRETVASIAREWPKLPGAQDRETKLEPLLYRVAASTHRGLVVVGPLLAHRRGPRHPLRQQPGVGPRDGGPSGASCCGSVSASTVVEARRRVVVALDELAPGAQHPHADHRERDAVIAEVGVRHNAVHGSGSRSGPRRWGHPLGRPSTSCFPRPRRVG